MQNQLKSILAKQALSLLKPNMVLGLGSGSTLEVFAQMLVGFLRENPMPIRVVSSSDRISNTVASLSVVPLDQVDEIDLTIDGLDYVNLQTGLVLKGNGGALYLEKKLAIKSKRVLLMADERKLQFSYSPKLMVEFSPDFIEELNQLGFKAREQISDSGNLVVECPLKHELEIFKLRDKLITTQGYLDDGDFSGLVNEVWIAYNGGEIKTFKLKDEYN